MLYFFLFIKSSIFALTNRRTSSATCNVFDSKLIFKAPKDDTYKIIATTFAAATGKYTLTVAPATEKQGKLQQVKDEFQCVLIGEERVKGKAQTVQVYGVPDPV